MLVWLASYPRSGNTLLRTIFRQAFGISTYSVYDENEAKVLNSRDGVADMVGHAAFGMSAPDFLAKARRAGETYLVKTHDQPSDDSKAIYVVRDGRAAVVSYWHFMNELVKRPTTFDEIICGSVFPGSWSQHLYAWQPRERANTLLLRYEDLVRDAEGAIGAIERFLDTPRIGTFDLTFGQMHTAFPTFFRAGSNAVNIRELDRRTLEMFERVHGATMMEYGYESDTLASVARDHGLDPGGDQKGAP
jgi:sulfotransferase family protein